jgi:hypothetical protein
MRCVKLSSHLWQEKGVNTGNPPFSFLVLMTTTWASERLWVPCVSLALCASDASRRLRGLLPREVDKHLDAEGVECDISGRRLNDRVSKCMC